MSRWWDTDVADASNALYSDPALALQAASVPQALVQSQAQYKQDEEQARQDKGGFLGAVASAFGKADAWMSNIPGWGVAKNVVWTPIDKVASGMYWAYSNVVSQPISTLLLQAAKADIASAEGGSWWDTMTGGDEWSDAYRRAEHISPGQAFMNYENLSQATGEGTYLSEFFGDAGEELPESEKKRVKQSMERFLYDTDYWRDKGGWKYTVGSGSIDFMFNILDPVGAGIVGGVAKTVKAGRSVEFVAQKAEHAAVVPGTAGVARTRGPVLDLFIKQQTPAEAMQTPTMQKTFDWMKEDGRTVEQIANHPIFGRGRRKNPARYDIANLVKETPRDSMELLWRFSVKDSTAGRELAAKAPEVLKKVGQIADNRILLEGVRMQPAMISAFKAEAEGMEIPRDPNLLIEPPTPRPTEPGIRQEGWDRRWGDLAANATANRTAANYIARTSPLRMMNPAENTTYGDALKGEEWRAAKLATLADDYDELINKEQYLGRILGDMDNWTPASSPLFGTIGRLYRSGGLAVRNTEKAAERATIARAGKRPAARGGNFLMTTVKRGMGAPMTIIHAMGDRTPEGFVNHSSDDARDRVFDMLKQVKGMTPEQRVDLIEVYNVAGNKVERSEALKKIHDTVLNHILIKDGGMDPELATVLKNAITDGVGSQLAKLAGISGDRAQVFGPKATTADDLAKLQGSEVEDVTDLAPVRSDRVYVEEDGAGVILSPLAQTQLKASEILLPIVELQRLVKRSSGAMMTARRAGATAKDVVVKHLDSFDNYWKFATLMRPGFVPRMISDEVLARMFKFGGMATLLDTTKGMGHFLENRSRQVGSIFGATSYVPATGKGVASKRARVVIDDPEVMKTAEKLGLKTARVQVPPTLRMAYGRIQDERDLLKEVRKELAITTRKGDASPEYVESLRDQVGDIENTIKEYHDYVDEILRVAEVSKGRRLGDSDFTYKIGGTTYRVPQAFSEEWDNPIPRDQISTDQAWKALFTRGEQLDRQRFLSHAEKTGAYAYVDPDQPHHMESWLDALNKQIRQDPFHRMIAGGMSDKDALRWLNTTATGRKYMGQMGYWNQNKEQFVRNVRFMIDKYAADDVLKQKLADGEAITEAELRAAFSRDEFPIVHGEELKEHSALTYRETASSYRDKYMERAWKYVAGVPGDVLSRNPAYLQIHQAEMQELIRQQFHYKMQNFGDDTITPKEWESMNQKAHKLAQGKMRQVVFDPVNTTGSQALRFIYPFFKPHIDGLDRWAGLIAERPEQLSKLAKIYNAPVAANLVTDKSGYSVDQDGNVEVPDGEAIAAQAAKLGRPLTQEEIDKIPKVKQFVPLKDRVLHLKAPWAKPMDKEIASIRMQSLNTILPGDPWFDPGTGPIVQVAGNQLAKSSPSAGEFLQWAKILPYGPQEDTLDLLTPKYMKSVYDAYIGQDVENEKYQQAVLDVYNMRTAQYHEQLRAGEHAEPPSMKEIQGEAKKFLWLQALTDWASPASIKSSPLTGTKYQFFADQFNALQKQDPQNARDLFLAQFGEDYFGFTAAMTESMGVAASITADEQMEKYRDLIAEDPDMAPLVVGDVYNGGPFSAAVYQKQLHDEIGGERVRRKLTAEEAINESRTQEGWREYMQAMGALDSELIRAGFRSYADSGAEVFQQAKRGITEAIASKNTAWANAFGTTDREKVPNRIRFMEKAITDPRLMNDPLRQDMKSLASYLVVRSQFKQMLAQRGLQELSFDLEGFPAGEAADIGYQWRQAQMYFKNQSVGFGQLFNRYLNNDDLQ